MRSFLVIATLFSLLLAVLVSPFASEQPDGLERVAEDHAFADNARDVWSKAPLPDYAAPLPGLDHAPALQTAVAGAIGTAAVFTLLLAGGRLLKPRSPRSV